jgi:hypothetical protein
MDSLQSVPDGEDGLLEARTKALGQMRESRKAQGKESPDLLRGWVECRLITRPKQIQTTTLQARFLLLRLRLTMMVGIIEEASANAKTNSLNHVPGFLGLLNTLLNDRIRRSRLDRLSRTHGVTSPTPRQAHHPLQIKEWGLREVQRRKRNE